ncbi:MAG: YidH family protein [bacterium]
MTEGDEEVDYRFILANERTFLAWMRTGLALVAGGVALDQFVAVGRAGGAVRFVALGTIALGAVVALVGVLRWTQTENAIRSGSPLPRSRVAPWLGLAFVVLAATIAVVLLVGGG